MKKILMTIFIFTFVLFITSCDNREDDSTGLISSDMSENITTNTEETTTDAGIIPNTAGIVVLKGVIHPWEPNVNITERTDIPEEERGVGAASGESYYADEDAKRLGVSKILVMQVTDSVVRAEKEIFSRINELLVTKYGCDFVVSFIGLNSRMTPDWDDNIWFWEYDDNLKYMKENKQQVDIITSREGVVDYSTLISEGYLEDITDYLNNTGEGRKLYNAFPMEVWDTIARKGRIYGYSGGNLYDSSYYKISGRVWSLNCNKAVAKKLGIEVEDGFSFYDIEDILVNAKLTEETSQDTVLLYAPKEYFYRMLGYYDMGCGIFAKKDDNGDWIAFNGMEDEEFIKLCKVLRTYNENGWLKTDRASKVASTKGEALFSVYEYDFGYDGIGKYPIGREKDKILMEKDVSKGKTLVHDVTFGEIYYSYMDMQETVYGITSWSEHKEEALKLLTLFCTEAGLANGFKYGLEGVHYEYMDEDNQMKDLMRNKEVCGEKAPVNHIITYPVNLEPDDKLEFYKDEYAKFENGPLMDYEITFNREEELADIYDPECILYQVYDQGYSKLMSGVYEDVDAVVAEIKRIQKEAGIDEYIAAINAEFESCRNKKVAE